MTDDKQRKLSQYFMPLWASEMLYDAHFSHLGTNDMVWEPTCGNGSLLRAVPAHIPCFGTEIDPLLAKEAQDRSRRAVIVGDCLSVDIPYRVTAVLGNPPFVLEFFIRLLSRCQSLLGMGCQAGFVLPAYFFQTSRTVMDFSDKWMIHQEIIPRDLFPNLIKPLVFARFTRDNRRRLIGFRLFMEASQMWDMADGPRETLLRGGKGSRGIWRQAVGDVIDKMGGKAHISAIYSAFESSRPTDNPFWKEKIRQTCQRSFTRVDNATYAIPN